MSRLSRGLVFKLASGALLCILGLCLLRLLFIRSVACTHGGGSATVGGHDSPVGPVIHVVYSLCGGDAKLEDLLVSLTSMYVMAQNDSALYDVHVISDGSVGPQHLARFSRRRALTPARRGATSLFLLHDREASIVGEMQRLDCLQRPAAI